MPETNRPPACELHFWFDPNRDCPSCKNLFRQRTEDILSPDFEIIEAQKAGDDICGRTPIQKLADTLNEAVRMVAELPQDEPGVEVSGTFGFYIDGYTLASTENIGEVRLTSYDGRTCIVKSAALTEWVERRLPEKTS